MTLPASLPEQATAGRALAKAFANRSFLIGFVVTALIAAMALVSFLWTPYDVTRLIVADRNQAPSLAHWFGTGPEFWMDLQTAHDVRTAKEQAGAEISSLPTSERLPIRARRATG